MCITPITSDVQHTDLHRMFLTILPKIEGHLRVALRGIRCRHRKADLVAEAVALSWRWFVRLSQRGKDATQFPVVLADFATRHVLAGRRLCGQDKARDVLSPRAQHMHGFTVEHLPSSTQTPFERLYGSVNGQRDIDAFEERLIDNTMTPPDEQAQFRIDFRAWLKTLTGRERKIVRAMARDERTSDLAIEFKVSPGRISQMRSEFKDGWQRFVGDVPPREALSTSAA